MKGCSCSGVSLRAVLLISCGIVAACGKTTLQHDDVLAFIDEADDAAQRGDASDICEMRGQDFTASFRLESENPRNNTGGNTNRRVFCSSAVSFARLEQYELKRNSINIDIAEDGLTAMVVATYEERLPFFDPRITRLTAGEFDDYQIVETTDNSLVGIEDGDIVFLSTTSKSFQTLVPKTEMAVRNRQD